MAEQAESAPPEPEDWNEAQRRYWDAWMNLALQGLARDGGQAGPSWAEALGNWWQAAPWQAAPWQAAPHSGTGLHELLDKLIPQGQGFLALGEQILALSRTLEDARRHGGDPQDAVNRAFDTLRETFFRPFEGDGEAHPGLAAFWGLPLDTWQRVASTLSILPGDALQALRAESYRPAALREQLDRTLGTPALGYTREWQEQAQQGAQLWLDYQETHREYLALMHRAADRSLERLRQRLAERARENRPLHTLREVYNLWVDCSEETYAETVRSAEFSQVQGRMINALMRFKYHGRRMVDETLSGLGIPNRRELDTAHARAQAMRRRLAALEERLAAPEIGRETIDGLQADIQALREELSTERLMSALQDDIRGLREELNTLKEGAAKKTTPRRRRTTASKKTAGGNKP